MKGFSTGQTSGTATDPAGISPRLPDFIIGGAPRSGTTWLYRLLERHPEIYVAKPLRPEPKFFLVDDLFARGIDYYSRTWFGDVPEGMLAGEKSTNYLESRSAAERIRRHLPSVRLFFVLREPAQRAYSNYLWSRMNGFEDQSFEVALDLEEGRERACPPELRFARPHAYFSRGRYADLLSAYFELFESQQILCLRFEDTIASPQGVAVRVHEFLGVSPRPGDADAVGVVNPSVGPPADPAVLASLRHRYQDSNLRLVQLLGPDFTWSA